jgi:hypothetical protein
VINRFVDLIDRRLETSRSEVVVLALVQIGLGNRLK